jgi:hypothetical protein
MRELRKEQEARTAAETSPSQANREVNKVNEVNKVPTPSSKCALAVDREPATPAQLASFGKGVSSEEGPVSGNASDLTLQTSHLKLEEEKTTPHGVTTNEEEPATRPAAEPLHASFHETNPIGEGASRRQRDCFQRDSVA